MDSDSMISSIADEAGTGFIVGSTAGFGYHFFKGYKTRTFTNCLRAAISHVPRIGGAGVKWTLLLYAVNNGLATLRNRSNPLNRFCAGTVTVATANRGNTFVVVAGVCLGAIMTAVEAMSIERQKLEARLYWRPTGLPGRIDEEFALMELTRLARTNAFTDKTTSL